MGDFFDSIFFFFNDTATTEIYTLSLHDALPIWIDLNSSGLRKPCRERYPSEWIVEKCKKLNIELLIGTDAHCEEEIEAGLNQISYLI